MALHLLTSLQLLITVYLIFFVVAYFYSYFITDIIYCKIIEIFIQTMKKHKFWNDMD